jgi:hypothetical protein
VRRNDQKIKKGVMNGMVSMHVLQRNFGFRKGGKINVLKQEELGGGRKREGGDLCSF